MKNFLKKNEVLIPFILYLFFSVVMLALLALPTSIYSILSLSSTLSSASENMPLSLTSLLSILLVVCLPVQVILALLGLFSRKLYLARIELILNTILYSISVLAFTVIIITGSLTTIENAALFTPANYVVYVLYLLGFASFLVTSHLCVYKPYKVMARELKENEAKEEDISEKQRQQYREELKDMDKEKMKAYLLEKRNSGQLSEEKYLEFLASLDEK